ncbi:sorbitol dehydrogenase family protein [Gluconacetobacter entanii]|uniref:Sorbitol dehydrogenase family protein n=1 Tax=Gluconacetobacter entanii TaxID=108528 RepID=A0ABT3K772_9PROT|nr:sorbitol dehydrogenase family protein [Gluconacetobacter entanii]MCW4591219.1 sorbitol dehydrogenase family protein [Gluconacetobacter entanii]MCW4595461.1 sorbitol dehydrogenase family protein [Gluconacetobacter entanii]NPC88543.1 sorbitol dehydrogenase [Gluconacetobacter entanii]
MATDQHCFPADIHHSTPNRVRLNRLVRMSRRDVLLGSMGVALACGTTGAFAAAPDDADIAAFMAVSQRLTDRDALDPRIGHALFMGIVHAVPTRRDQVNRLHDLMTKNSFASAHDMAKAAEQADPGFKDVIHDIMTGWYRGLADHKVVVYRSALMFDITKDAVYPKTYAAGGPFYWTKTPPEVAVPTGEPALSPSTFVVEPT